MNEDLRIAAINIADHYDIMFRLMEHLHIHEHELSDKIASWADIGAGYMRHVIAMQQECGGLCLMAYMAGVPAGFIFGYTEEPDDSRIDIYTGPELYVSDGFVLPEYRRLGIYRTLNEQLEQHYVSRGVKRILRFTMVNNTRMRQLLESKDYAVSRVLYEKWL